MGRQAWANEDQWVWLKAQALEYLKIKGTKETPKFWGPFFNEWQTKWPTPVLTDTVHMGSSSSSTGESPTNASETPVDASKTPASSDESADTVGAKSAKSAKSKKVLTVQTVCAVMLASDMYLTQ